MVTMVTQISVFGDKQSHITCVFVVSYHPSSPVFVKAAHSPVIAAHVTALASLLKAPCCVKFALPVFSNSNMRL